MQLAQAAALVLFICTGRISWACATQSAPYILRYFHRCRRLFRRRQLRRRHPSPHRARRSRGRRPRRVGNTDCWQRCNAVTNIDCSLHPGPPPSSSPYPLQLAMKSFKKTLVRSLYSLLYSALLICILCIAQQEGLEFVQEQGSQASRPTFSTKSSSQHFKAIAKPPTACTTVPLLSLLQ